MADQYRLVTADLLIPGRGTPLEKAALVYEGGRITWVGLQCVLPESFRDLSVEYHAPVLMPGLWDCHCHFFGAHQVSLDAFSKVPQALAGARAARDAADVLNAGFTSVRELGGYGYLLDVAIQEGVLLGPKIYSAISPISQTGGHGDGHDTPLHAFKDAIMHGVPLHLCDGVEECLKAVRLQLRRGAKVIKLCASGGVGSQLDDPHNQQFSDDELRVMVEEAHRAGRVVAAHCHGKPGIDAALRAGCTTIEHGTYMDDESMNAMLQKGAILIPTRTIMEAGLKMRAAWSDESYRKLEETALVHQKMYRKAISAGVKIALGSDLCLSAPGSPLGHGRNGMELKYAVEFGLTPLHAIEAATASAPETLGPQAPVSGQLKEGYDADFLAVSANPLLDIELLTNPANVTHIWQAGELVKSPGMSKWPL